MYGGKDFRLYSDLYCSFLPPFELESMLSWMGSGMKASCSAYRVGRWRVESIDTGMLFAMR